MVRLQPIRPLPLCGKPYQTTTCARPAGHTAGCFACLPRKS